MEKIITSFFIVLCFSSCFNEGKTSQRPEDTKLVRFTMDEMEELSQSIYAEYILITPPLASVRKSQFWNRNLLFSELQDSDSLVRIINLDSPQSQWHLLKAGSGPNELSFVDLLLKTDEKLQLYDPHTMMLSIYSIEDRKAINNLVPDTYVKVKSLFADYVFNVNDNFFATYLVGEQKKRFAKIDNKGEVVEYFGELPFHPRLDEIDPKILNMIYTARISVRPDEKKIALAYNYEDLIEIYDENGILQKSIKGPDIFYPEFEIRQRSNGGFSKAPIRGKTRAGIITLQSTRENIYCLYSGKFTHPSKNDLTPEKSYESKSLIVFDWQGNLIKYLKLDANIYDFCIDENTKTIYGVTEEKDNELVFFNYQ